MTNIGWASNLTRNAVAGGEDVGDIRYIHQVWNMSSQNLPFTSSDYGRRCSSFVLDDVWRTFVFHNLGDGPYNVSIVCEYGELTLICRILTIHTNCTMRSCLAILNRVLKNEYLYSKPIFKTKLNSTVVTCMMPGHELQFLFR